MTTRRHFGKYLKQVKHSHKRFEITMRGKVVALLVPPSDKEAIEKQVTAEQLDRMYAALAQMDGIITSDASDTSRNIDEIVYGHAYDEAQQEVND